ncbi:unnamed protein product [Caenorhabditis angaria]|uniref:ABC transporter domain-containing protein n=1 Tax=Caenorhabditis angaria TaxID=860376 RepID=A0A9P1MS40_9PELO|nr:unnamed protein product [Caenorhabditis angaria]
MVRFTRQLNFLLWKCILVKKRQKFWLAVELIVPCLLFIIIALVRTRDFNESREQCHYDSKGMLSSGILPFIHSYFCSFSNRCYNSPTTGDEKESLFIGKSKNESIVVDLIYYSSLQLRWIGEHPNEFEEFVKASAEVIHFLSLLKLETPGIITINELLGKELQPVVFSRLRQSNISETTANKLLGASILPGIYEVRRVIDPDSLDFMSMFSNPLFCDDRLLENSFYFKEKLEKSEKEELCDKLTLVDLADYQDVFQNVSLPIESRLNLAKYMSDFQMIFKPSFEFLNKYQNTSNNDLLLAVFCGNNPMDIIEQSINPTNEIQVETPFQKMREKLIKFIQTVTPGKHIQNGTCTPITYHKEMNCSSLEGPMLTEFMPILQGYILVSPENAATRRMIDKLNEPLQYVEYIRNLLFNYPSESTNLQWSLHNSDLWPASQNILKILNSNATFMTTHAEIMTNPTLKFIFEHFFADPSDPYSFGPYTSQFVQVANQYLSCFLVDRFRFVNNEKEMEDNALCLMDGKQYFSGIVFEGMKINSTHFDEFTTYKIRHYPSFTDSTSGFMDSRSNPFSRNRPFQDLKYLTFGFSYLQESIDNFLISDRGGNGEKIGVFAQQEPFPCTTKDTFNVALFMPLFLLISFILPSALLVKNIVYEKELKIKEQMRSMGLGDSVHFISWALISLVLNFLSALVISLITKFAKIFNNTDYTLLLFILILFVFASIAMSLFFTTFFTNANIATAATCVLWFMFFIPFQLKADDLKTPTFNRICLLLPPTAMGHLFKLLESFNAIERATWADVPEMVDPSLGLSVERCMIMLVVDTVIFLILAWYISAVAPGEFGVRQPFYFPLTIRYWLPNFYHNRVEFLDDDENFDVIQNGDNFDTEPTGMKVTVHINSMSKVYENGTKALDGLNLRLYENQITGLLGHNGAGKTTTMSILCGFYAPSSGTAKIYSRDIRTDLRRVREVLGICPQHNVLFTFLTVAEQLRLFAALKGVPDDELDQQVDEILTSVSLKEKANKLANTLSGGMKRRLCIGIAFIGGSKFVILDEPTAGVDVTARKEIWKLLQNNKKGRTIMLSTHHMDEADVLSDRIAILSHGQCITVGSSVFLKRRFGNNMTLSVVKQDSKIEYSQISKEICEMGKDVGVFLDVSDENEEEVVFNIPIQTDSDKLEVFFMKLDESLQNFKLGQYGISAPTLQKIFVSLAPQKEYNVPKVSKFAWVRKLKSKVFKESEEDRNDLIEEQRNGTIQNNMPSTSNIENIQIQNNEIEEDTMKFEDFEKPELLDGFVLTLQHFYALLVCRMNYTLKSKRIFLFQVLIPLLLLVICELYVVSQVPSSRPDLIISQLPLPLETGLFGNMSDFYVNNWDSTANSTSTSILKSMFESPGTGPRCADDVPNLVPYHMDLYIRNHYGLGRRQPTPGVTREFIANFEECQNIQGNFNYAQNLSLIDYNSPVYCDCVDFGWNCTLEDWDWQTTNWMRLNTTDRIFDMTGRNLTQFRLVTRNQEINNKTAPFFLGGFSLGHINHRAQSKEQIENAKKGWNLVVEDTFMFTKIINMNTSSIEPDIPKIIDPFLMNVTITQVVDGLLQNLDVKLNVKTWFDNKIWPALPISSNILSNSLMRDFNKQIAPEKLGIFTLNHPMNKTAEESLSASATGFAQSLALFRITCLLLVLSMIPAGFTVYLVEDRVCEALHLQLVGGLKKTTYWITSYLYDMVIYTIVVIFIMCLYAIFHVNEFTGTIESFCAFLIVFFLYGACAVLYSYVLQRHFRVAALCFVFIAIGSYFIGTICALTVIMLENLMQKDPTLVPAHTVCSWVFLIMPQYNLGLSIFRGSMVYQVKKVGINFLENINRSDMIDKLPLPRLLDWDVMGLHVVFLIIHCFVAAGCLVFSQMDEFSFMRHREREMTTSMMLKDQTNDDDEDVIKEKNRVDSIPQSVHNNALVVRNLAKAYTAEQLAVRGISFAVEPGECFGLLGLNGAGKTTTFSMLTAKIWPGHGLIEMHDTRISPFSSVTKHDFKQLGYCPQFDALNMKLTTRENLKFYARIRGIVPNQINSIIDRLLVALHLKPYSDTMTASLSGGNRRKLSVAVALVSQPSLVFLDEPSAGMDPGSQQFLWKVIERLCKSGKAVVLTSHSMEECEALCTRIAIMDRGIIRCLGGKQHLKNKFGKGSMLTLKLSKMDEAGKVAELMKERIYGSRIEAIHCSTVFIHIEQGTSSVAQILKVVNKAKRTYSMEDFTLSQSTLDNVFQSLSENSLYSSSSPSSSSPPQPQESIVVIPSDRTEAYTA